MSALDYQERPAAGEAEGLLVLHHGRGADEFDLIGLADVLDPQRRLHIVTPGGPLRLAGSPGRHWYVVPRVGYPDPDTFAAAYEQLALFHDELWARTGIGPQRTVFGGFSMGSVMSYAMGLPRERPRVAGLLIFAGFIPTVPVWAPDLPAVSQAGTRVFIAHGRRDPVMDVRFAREAHMLLDEGDVVNEYHETDVGHQIDPTVLRPAISWLGDTLPAP